MAKTKESEYKKLLTRYEMELDARYDGDTGFIYFKGGRAFFAVKDGELDVRESWGEPTQRQAQQIYHVLTAWLEYLKQKKSDGETAQTA